MSLQSQSPTAILRLVRGLIPPLADKLHKGQAGRIVVVGGCEDYTGAPFFSAMASTLLGADMSHIICERNAAPAIKSYSPNIMVHPYLYDSTSQKQYASYGVPTDTESIMQKVFTVINRVDVVVVGPGLGRDEVILNLASKIIEEAKTRAIPLVIDADGLFLIQQNPEIIKGYKRAILTPNVIEFSRLQDAVGLKPTRGNTTREDHIASLQKLSGLLGGVTIVEKGLSDFITNDTLTIENNLPGGRKRVSGQGDTLSGSMATFLAWYLASSQTSGALDKNIYTEENSLLLAAFGASAITRYASYKAFKVHGRALVTSQISEYVGEAYNDFFETPEKAKDYIANALPKV